MLHWKTPFYSLLKGTCSTGTQLPPRRQSPALQKPEGLSQLTSNHTSCYHGHVQGKGMRLTTRTPPLVVAAIACSTSLKHPLNSQVFICLGCGEARRASQKENIFLNKTAEPHIILTKLLSPQSTNPKCSAQAATTYSQADTRRACLPGGACACVCE